MAPRLGDEVTSDVELHLVIEVKFSDALECVASNDGKKRKMEADSNPSKRRKESASPSDEQEKASAAEELYVLLVHTEVLSCYSEYFKALFSDRWNKNKESEQQQERRKIRVVASNGSVESYYNFFKFMYACAESDTPKVEGLEQALGFLAKSAIFLCHSLIQLIMYYISGVYWDAATEKRIRALVSELGMPVHEELKARLDIPSYDILIKAASRMLKSFTQHPESKHTEARIHKFIDKLKVNDQVRPHLIALIEKEWRVRLAAVKIALQQYYPHPDLKLFVKVTEIMIQLGCHVEVVSEALAAGEFLRCVGRMNYYATEFVQQMLRIIIAIVKDSLTGSIVLGRDLRLKLAQALVKVDDIKCGRLEADKATMCDLVIKLIMTLPLTDQDKVFEVWVDGGLIADMGNALEWWQAKVLSGL